MPKLTKDGRWLALGFITIVAYAGVGAALMHLVPVSVNATLVVDALVIGAGLVVWCWYVWRLKRTDGSQAVVAHLRRAFPKPPQRALSTWLVGLISASFGAQLVLAWGDPSYTNYSHSMSSASALAVLTLVLVAAPLSEEIMFRGIFGQVRSKPILAMLLATGVFAAVHGTIAHLALCIPLGLLAWWLRQASGSLLYSILGHAGFNFFNIYATVLATHLISSVGLGAATGVIAAIWIVGVVYLLGANLNEYGVNLGRVVGQNWVRRLYGVPKRGR